MSFNNYPNNNSNNNTPGKSNITLININDKSIQDFIRNIGNPNDLEKIFDITMKMRHEMENNENSACNTNQIIFDEFKKLKISQNDKETIKFMNVDTFDKKWIKDLHCLLMYKPDNTINIDNRRFYLFFVRGIDILKLMYYDDNLFDCFFRIITNEKIFDVTTTTNTDILTLARDNIKNISDIKNKKVSDINLEIISYPNLLNILDEKQKNNNKIDKFYVFKKSHKNDANNNFWKEMKLTMKNVTYYNGSFDVVYAIRSDNNIPDNTIPDNIQEMPSLMKVNNSKCVLPANMTNVTDYMLANPDKLLNECYEKSDIHAVIKEAMRRGAPIPDVWMNEKLGIDKENEKRNNQNYLNKLGPTKTGGDNNDGYYDTLTSLTHEMKYLVGGLFDDSD